jgi:hypothetical protein
MFKLVHAAANLHHFLELCNKMTEIRRNIVTLHQILQTAVFGFMLAGLVVQDAI